MSAFESGWVVTDLRIHVIRTPKRRFGPIDLLSFVLLLLLWHYSPGWALASFKSFRQSSRLWAVLFQFLHPALAASSAIWSSHLNLGLPFGLLPPAHLSLLSFINLTTSFPLESSQSSLLFVHRVFFIVIWISHGDDCESTVLWYVNPRSVLQIYRRFGDSRLLLDISIYLTMFMMLYSSRFISFLTSMWKLQVWLWWNHHWSPSAFLFLLRAIIYWWLLYVPPVLILVISLNVS